MKNCLGHATITAIGLLVVLPTAFPAEAGKMSNAGKPVEQSLPDPANGEPMTLIVSLSQQKCRKRT